MNKQTIIATIVLAGLLAQGKLSNAAEGDKPLSSSTVVAQTEKRFVHSLFTSHMVLQRDAVDPVWGWSTVGNTVTVTVHDPNHAIIQTKTALADAKGRWQVNLDPLKLTANNAPCSLTISAKGEETVTLSDVLIGDVFLISGQSNMEYGLKNAVNPQAEIADSVNYPNIRQIKVAWTLAREPQEEIGPIANPTIYGGRWHAEGVGAQAGFHRVTTGGGGPWKAAGLKTTETFGAVPYFMMRELYKRNGVPLGILQSTFQGTAIMLWVDPVTTGKLSECKQTLFDFKLLPMNVLKNGVCWPSVSELCNGMIAPLAPFRVRAVAWYQGESDAGWSQRYAQVLSAMMAGWRKLFDQPNLPFLIVQLPMWPEIREAQLNTVLNDPHSRLVTTVDVGGAIPNPDGKTPPPVHYLNKQDVGQRLCWAAEDLVYGKKVVGQGPLFKGFAITGNTVRCTFTQVGAGLMVGKKNYQVPLTPTEPVEGGKLVGFALAGADGVFHAADAVISGMDEVTVSCSQVSTPVAVRYAWADNPQCNLYNKIVDASGKVVDGLPASPFRSDQSSLLICWPRPVAGGGGAYPLNTEATITAPTIAGLTFHHWSGDTDCLTSTTAAKTSVRLSKAYVSVFSNYQVTGAPSKFAAAVKPGEVTLTWDAKKFLHYHVKRATTENGPYATVYSGLGSIRQHVDSDVKKGATYYYRISAESVMGEGPDSPPLKVEVPSSLHDQ